MHWTLILLAPLVVWGQQGSENRTEASCFLLKDSRACPGLQNYAVQRTNLYANVQELDSFIFGLLLRDKASVQQFKEDYECPGFDGGHFRYKRSLLCFALIQNPKCSSEMKTEQPPRLYSKSCASNTSGTILSRRQDAVFSSSTASSSVSAIVSLPLYCEGLKDSDSECKLGLVEDFESCGFDSQLNSAEFCKANPNLPCCSAGPQRVFTTLLQNPNANQILYITSFSMGLFVFLIAYFIIVGLTAHRRTTPSENASGRATQSHYFGAPPKVLLDALSMPPILKPQPIKLSIVPNIRTTSRDIQLKSPPPKDISLTPKSPDGVILTFTSQPISSSVNQERTRSPASTHTDERKNQQQKTEWPHSPSSLYSDPYTPIMGSPITYVTKNGFRIHSGRTYKARRQHKANKQAELNLEPGSVVRIYEVFDDGLAFAQAIETGEKGFFDITCVETN